jgi:hypothetical protein
MVPSGSTIDGEVNVPMNRPNMGFSLNVAAVRSINSRRPDESQGGQTRNESLDSFHKFLMTRNLFAFDIIVAAKNVN